MIMTNLKLQNNLPNLIIRSNISHSFKNGRKVCGSAFSTRRVVQIRRRYLLCEKVSRSISILYKIRNYLPLNSLVQFYYTFMYSHFIYYNLIWGNTFETHLKPLIILKKNVIRIINDVNFNCHTNELFHRNERVYAQIWGARGASIFFFFLLPPPKARLPKWAPKVPLRRWLRRVFREYVLSLKLFFYRCEFILIVYMFRLFFIIQNYTTKSYHVNIDYNCL